jgi:hypothetical protein
MLAKPAHVEAQPVSNPSQGAAAAGAGFWPTRGLTAIGVQSPGIAASDAAVGDATDLKFRYYSDPVPYGVSDISDEGRMFLEAVARGHVPKTAAGLMTMLAWGGMGDINRDGTLNGRPAEIGAFFREWYGGLSATRAQQAHR